MATKKRFTIERAGRDKYELTVVGKTGMVHTYSRNTRHNGAQHFTHEGRYRRAIEQATKQNGGK